jgi:hypothetical protein
VKDLKKKIKMKNILKIFSILIIFNNLISFNNAQSYCLSYEVNTDLKGNDITYSYDVKTPQGYVYFIISHIFN